MSTWHERHKKESTPFGRLADAVASFVGSWPFFIVHIVWFALWIGLRVEPFPYGLLTMIVSLEAILLATIIIMSQNRQGERDRHQAAADYDTDRKAEVKLEALEKRIARLETEKIDVILAHVKK